MNNNEKTSGERDNMAIVMQAIIAYSFCVSKRKEGFDKNEFSGGWPTCGL